MEKKLKVCDTCGKKVEIETSGKTGFMYITPQGWLRLQKIHLSYRKDYKKENIQPKNIIDIGNADPDFCSKECFLSWMVEQVDRITQA